MVQLHKNKDHRKILEELFGKILNIQQIVMKYKEASQYEKQWCATIAGLVTKSEARDVRKITRHQPSKRMVACDDYSF